MRIGDDMGDLLPGETMSEFFHSIGSNALFFGHFEYVKDQRLLIEKEIHAVVILILHYFFYLFL